MATIGPSLPLFEHSVSSAAEKPQSKKLEDYRPGYPRYTALLAAYDPYTICRRFSKLRARLLLLKQDRLSLLEERLEKVDREERSPLFLGKSRCDGNLERISLLSEIESQLSDYETDQFVDRTHRMLSLGPAQKRDVESLQNWLDGNGCLTREECAYLEHDRELVSLAPAGDCAISQFEAWVEDKLIRLSGNFRMGNFHNISNDPNVYIYSGSLIKRIAKALLLLLITLFLLIPVVVCNIISTTSIRISVVMACTISYLLMLSALTKSRTIELVLAGATYTAVLIVFVSGSSIEQG